MDKVSVGDLITVAIFVVGSVAGIARHWWNQHHHRINVLDERTQQMAREMETKVSIKMHNDTVDALRKDIQQGNREIREELRGITARIDAFLLKERDEK